jgi:hypothetical protein
VLVVLITQETTLYLCFHMHYRAQVSSASAVLKDGKFVICLFIRFFPYTFIYKY